MVKHKNVIISYGSVIKDVAEQPRQQCVGSTINSEDGELLMFVDSKNNNTFLLCKDSGKKIPYPCLPMPVKRFYKCIIRRCNEEGYKSSDQKICSNYAVYFFCKDGSSYIFCSPDSKIRNWQWVEYPRDVYNDVILLKFNHVDEYDMLCYINNSGLFRSENFEVKPPSYGSFMYTRWLVANNGVNSSCFLAERKAQGSWYLWEIDVWQPKGKYLVSMTVPTSKGIIVCLSENYSGIFSFSTDFGFKGNCICFTETGDDKNVYVFCFADHSLSVFTNQSNSGFPIYFPNPGMPCISFMKNNFPESAMSVEPENMSCDLLNNFGRLHEDFVSSILGSVSLRDYASYREVCKGWKELARPICWKPQLTSSFTPSSVMFPWLMLFNETDEYNSSFIDPISNMKYYYKTNGDLSGCEIRYSKNGWLLVTRGKSTIFFFEPFSKKKINLPDFPEGLNIDGMSFSSSPESKDWIIVAIQSTQEILTVTYLKFGYENWNRVGGRTPEDPFISCGCSPVFHDGDSKFYFMSQTGDLLLFRQYLPEPTLRIIRKRSGAFSNERRGYLVSCNGNLCLVVIMGLLGKLVEVYKWWNNSLEWKKLESLGGFSLFISQTSSFAVQLTEGAQQNTINFPLLARNRCLSYKLGDSDFNCYDGNNCISSLYPRKEYFCGSWIQPKVFQDYR